MAKLPDAWLKFRTMRDSSPSLVDTPVREAAISRARFLKAIRIADALAHMPADWPSDPTAFTEHHWEACMVVAGVADASPATRILVVELLKDRAKQREGLMDEDEAREFCASNYTPTELYR